jgi:hypothetical protein
LTSEIEEKVGLQMEIEELKEKVSKASNSSRVVGQEEEAKRPVSVASSVQMSHRFQSNASLDKEQSPVKQPTLHKPSLSISAQPLEVLQVATKESVTTKHGVSDEQVS